MWRYFYQRYGELSIAENFERCLHDMVRYNRMRHLHPDPERIRREYWQGEPGYGSLFTLFHRHHADRAGKQRWGDKSLHTELYADQVLTEFPRARIIHMVRDPRDRFTSVRKRHLRNASRVGAATGRWLVSMNSAKRNLERYPDNYRIISYEELASHPEETLHRLCEFIEEDYRPEMLTLQGDPAYLKRGGNSSFGQIERGAISTRSIGRFREVLSPVETAFIQQLTKSQMAEYGYQLEPVVMSPGERLQYYLATLPVNLARMLGWITISKLQLKRGMTVPEFRLVDVQFTAQENKSG